jgi:hypothetical protein
VIHGYPYPNLIAYGSRSARCFDWPCFLGARWCLGRALAFLWCTLVYSVTVSGGLRRFQKEPVTFDALTDCIHTGYRRLHGVCCVGMVRLSSTGMNLGGPGWFNDVFDVQVFFDTDKRSVPTGGDEDDSIEVRKVWMSLASILSMGEGYPADRTTDYQYLSCLLSRWLLGFDEESDSGRGFSISNCHDSTLTSVIFRRWCVGFAFLSNGSGQKHPIPFIGCGSFLHSACFHPLNLLISQLFLSNEMLTGKVRITPPPGRTVWQGGVSAKLESVISTCILAPAAR